MGIVALLLMAAFAVVDLVLPARRHRRATGDSPFRSNGAHGPLAVVGFGAPFVLAAILELGGTARVVPGPAPAAVGIGLAVAGILGTGWAQRTMGASWRVGIDVDERTDLVTSGPYRRVRNPIYTSMFAFAAGLALVVPNPASFVGLVAVVAVIDVVVRRIEEPYLESVHGAAFTSWAGATGRFVPGLGRRRPPRLA